MVDRHKFDGRLGDALRELQRLGALRAQGAQRRAWAAPAAAYVRTLAGTKFDEDTLRDHNIPSWAIYAILRERCQRPLKHDRAA